MLIRLLRPWFWFATAAAALAAAPALHAADDEHAHHHHHAAKADAGYKRQMATYRIPEISVVRNDGSSTTLTSEIDDGRPVVLNFIFTTCTAVCPVLTQNLAEFRRKLGADAASLHLVSISIDPQHDTPARLRAYAELFSADRSWSFLTGSVPASVSAQKAFQAYFGDKMHHRPMTFMRGAPGQPWIRLEGFATPDELVKEYRRLVAAP